MYFPIFFVVVLQFDTLYFELLAASLNKQQIDMRASLSPYGICRCEYHFGLSCIMPSPTLMHVSGSTLVYLHLP